MSSTIDQRVVEMQFNNRDFETNVSTSMSTLDKLKQSLNLNGATKGLENVDAAAKRVNLSGLGSAIETVHSKFSALEVMGITALANITNSAVNAGKRIASALTIQPIKTGFKEYETQIGAVQTILANTSNKGSTLQDVNRALDELNLYADKTIYNFAEMTKNIGRFTAAGVDLDTSVSAIQGIANLAAVSGSTSQQASTAMYQLSQALAAGRVNLMDWNSVVNAGMGGQVFQDALKQTARTMGKDVDGIIAKYGSFRESLSRGEWLTTDVLTKTLEQFTMAAEEGSEAWNNYKKSLMKEGYTEKQAVEILKMANTATDAATKVKTFTQLWDTLRETAQSGWAATWEIIVGDFEEAKRFLTTISDTIGPMLSNAASSRNAVLSEGLSSGWLQLLNQGISDEAGYKDLFKNVAKEHGVSIDKMVQAEKKLDSSLSDGEAFQKALSTGLKEGTITADMFSEAVHKMSDKMSKMSAEELEAAGYTQEHVQKIKALSDGLKNGSISMDEFTDKMTKTSGRENIITALLNTFKGLMSVIKPVKDAFGEIFSPITGDQIYSFTEALVELTSKLTISDTTANNLKRTFKGVFAIFDIGFQAVKAIFSVFDDLIGCIAPAGEGLLGFTAGIGDFLVGLDESIKSSGIFNKAAERVSEVLNNVGDKIKLVVDKIRTGVDGIKSFAKSLEPVIDKIVNFFSSMVNIDTSGIDNFADKVKARFEPLTFLLDGLKKIFDGVVAIVKKIAPIFSAIASVVGDAFGAFQDTIAESIENADYNSIFDIFNSGLFTAIILGITKFVKSLSDFGKNSGSIAEGVVGILDSVRGSLESWQMSIKAGVVETIAISLGIMAAALVALSLIDSGKLAIALAAITTLFVELIGAMTWFAMFANVNGLDAMGKVGRSMIGLSVALLILSAAMKIMSTMSWSEMAIGLISMTVGLAALVGAIILLPKDTTVKTSSIIGLATAMVILGTALKIMSTMSWGELAIGLLALVGGLGSLVGAMWLLPKDSSVKTAGVLGLAAAMVVLGTALKIMSTMSWEGLGVSILALVGGLGALVGAVALLPKDTLVRSAGMIGLATAMVVLGSAFKIMSTMSWEELGVSILALVGGLGALVGAIRLLPKDTLIRSAGMMGLASAMVVLGTALKTMGSMSWSEFAVGITSLAGSLLIITLAVKAMTLALPGAAALLVVAAALTVLTPVLLTLGNMSLAEIYKSLIALGGAFGVIGAAGLLLGPLTPVLVALGVAVALLGVGCLAAGVGLLAFSTGLSALAVAGSAGAAAMTLVISSIAGLIPFVIEQIGLGIVALCGVIASSGSAIYGAISTILVAIVNAITTVIPSIMSCITLIITEIINVIIAVTPQIMNCLSVILTGILNLLVTMVPQLMNLIGVALTSLLELLVSFIPQFVDSGMKIILGILEGIANNIGGIVESAINIVTNFIKGVANSLPGVIQAGIDLMLGFINGMADGIRNNSQATINAVNNLMDAIGGAIVAWYGNALTKGKELISKLIEGVKAKNEETKTAVKNLLSSAITAITNKIGEWTTAGADLISGFIQGIRNKAAAAVEAAKGVVSSALEGAKKLLGIASPSKEFAKVGMWSDEGLVVGLNKYAGKVVTAAENVGGKALDTMASLLSDIGSIIDDGIDSEPTIRPVLDLSNVNSGVKEIGGMFSDRTLSIDANNANVLAASMAGVQNGNSISDLTSVMKALRKDISEMPRNNYNINGITYDDGSNVSNAVSALVRAARIERRV